MMRHGRVCRRVIAALTVVLAVGLASISAAAGPTALVKASKHEEGPYSGGTITDHMSVGEVQDYFVRVVDHADKRRTFSLYSGVPESPGYEWTWFKGDQDITDAVTVFPGYEFETGRRAKVFRVSVEKTSGGGSQCIDGHLNRNGSQIDVSLI